MVEDQVLSLVTNLTAAGVTTTAAASTTRARDVLRRRQYSEEIESVATEFMQTLESAIEAENRRLESNELAGVTNDWTTIAEELAATRSDRHVQDTRPLESEQVDLLFRDEEEAVDELARAIADAKGFNLDQTPELRDALKAALSRAYREAIVKFEQELAGTDLADVFEMEIGIKLSTQVEKLEQRLAELGANIESLLTQPARDEGFRQLTPSGFSLGPEPRPERSWRIGFTFADVKAEIPAERIGRTGGELASVELLDALRDGEDRLIVGGAGSGKSTLCKQVATRWYDDESLGPVLYRESGAGGGSSFTSVEAMRQAITATDSHTLVVVEDAVQPEANAIFEVVESLSGYPDVSFLLDDLHTEVEEFDGSGPVESSLRPRQEDILNSLTRYHIPSLSVTDVERVIDAFEAATGKSVDRPAESLHEEINTRSDIGVGEMMLLSFLLPVGGGEDAATGLERNVRNRFETLDPTSATQLRDLSRFNEELVADIGVMVAILNASGIGIRPELVHSLGVEYGNDWETHDEIAEIRAALEGWFLYSARTASAADIVRTTHRLWSTLYLRELALKHELRQQESRRRSRSEKRFARCLNALFGAIDDPDERAALEEEFPRSSVLDRIENDPSTFAEELILDVFEIGENWPVLASLYGTTKSARYRFPDSCPGSVVLRAKELRGHTHRLRGDTAEARAEYEDVLELAQERDARRIQGRSYNHLGLVAEAETDLDTAVQRFEEGLEIFRSLQSPRGEAMCLSNLGLVAKKKGELETAKEYYERGLERFRDLNGTYIEIACLGNLGVLTQELGELSTARSYLRQSLELARSIDDRQGKAEALLGLGLIARNEGNFETASEYTERGLDIEQELGNRHGEAKALGIQGLIAREQDSLPEAREYCNRSIELFEVIGDEHGEATILGILAVVERNSGAHRDAAEAISRSLNLFTALGDRLGVAECRGLAGTIDIVRGETEVGRRKFGESLSDVRDIGARLTELQLIRHHMQAEFKQENSERVRTLYEQAQSCLAEVDDELGYEQELVEQYYRQVTS